MNHIDASRSKEREYEQKTGNTQGKHQQMAQLLDQQLGKPNKETPPSP